MIQPLATIATSRNEDWWQTRHQQKLIEVAGFTQPLDILFLGDSITHAWEVEGEKSWQQHFIPF